MDLIKFSKSLIGKYIEFYYGKSLKKLQLLTNLINLIKKNDKKFEFKYEDKDIDLIIHETGIELIKNKKMKNTEILDFIIRRLEDFYVVNTSRVIPCHVLARFTLSIYTVNV